MNSRIILTQADFSANNIGRYVELSDLTKKVLAKQTQYGEDSNEAIALNTFLFNLTNNGFIGGENPLIKCLIIPALASEHDELLYDIAHLDSNGYPTDVMNPDEKTATNKAFEVDTDNGIIVGLKRTTTKPDSLELSQITVDVFQYGSGGSYPSFSFATYNRVGYVTDATSATYLQNMSSETKFGYTRNQIQMKYGNKYPLTRSITADETNRMKGFIGISYNETAKDFELLADNITLGERTYNSEYPILVGGTNKVNVFDLGIYANTNFTYISVLALGNYLSSEQMAQFRGFVDTLMTNIHVKG